MAFIYEVNDDNAVSIWIDDSSQAPVIFQAETPEGNAWGSKAEAEAWAAAEVTMLEASAAVFAEAETLRIAEIEANAAAFAEAEALRLAEIEAAAPEPVVVEEPTAPAE